MAEARETGRFSFEEFQDVSGHTLLWPLSVIRLRSQNQNSLVACADRVLSTWRNYSDEACHILAHTDAPHNTITPIARKKGEFFELDLVLRNNRTTSEHPLGLFHPHADVHHIKRENIGLIEVMGLAVLPARLQAEMDEVKRFIVGETDNVQDLHQDWACELKRTYDGRENIERFIEMAVAEKFVKGLEDCGVFKLDENGQRGLQRFIQVIQSRD
jgi:UDPglucose--hexose-1-phosphate uridylyltransferase